MSRSDSTSANPSESGVSEDSNETRSSPDPNQDMSSGTTDRQQNLRRTRDLLEGLAARAFRRAERAMERHSSSGDGTPTSAETSLSSQIGSSGGSRESRSRRRRRRSRDSSSENDESVARRRRRASNVVESLRELLLVPTSSTLGESTEGTTPRSDSGGRIVAGDGANPGRNETANETANENANANETERSATSEGLGGRRQPLLRFNIANMLRNDDEDDDDDDDDDNENENESDESDDESLQIVDNTTNDVLGFEIDDLIDRDRIFNNLMERSMGMLRDIHSGGASNTTDLKCPVCSEVFVDYENSSHPNAPGCRSGTGRCSHGAMSLFTKLHHCPICFEEDIEPPNVVALACGHVICKEDFRKLGGHVGPARPPGQPKPKPVPGRARESVSPSPGSNANTSHAASFANHLSMSSRELQASHYSRWLSETAGTGIGLQALSAGTTAANTTDNAAAAGSGPPREST